MTTFEPLRNELSSVRDAQLSAQPSHIDDCLRFAMGRQSTASVVRVVDDASC